MKKNNIITYSGYDATKCLEKSMLINDLLNDYECGIIITALAIKYNITRPTVYKILLENGFIE